MVREAKQRDVERTLANLGWRLARTKGGHNVWVSPEGKMLAIPRHRVVSAGVVRQVIRTLGDQAPQEWR